MKLTFCLALLCWSTISHAALFNFRSTPPRLEASSAWVVDVETARQWYIAWASSAERVLRLVGPAPAPALRPTIVGRVVSEVILVGILAFFAAAFVSAAKSVLRVARPVPLTTRASAAR